MYSQFSFKNHYQFDPIQMNYQKCITGGNYLMLLSLFVVIVCLILSFGYETSLNMAIIIAAHILTIVFAGAFKIGYVIRCIGVHGLGYKVF